MVGLDGEQCITRRDHAIPGAVRLEVFFFRILDRVCFEKGAQIGDYIPGSIGVDSDHGVWYIGYAVGTACSGQDGIQSPFQEGHICHAADEATCFRRDLRRG